MKQKELKNLNLEKAEYKTELNKKQFLILKVENTIEDLIIKVNSVFSEFPKLPVDEVIISGSFKFDI